MNSSQTISRKIEKKVWIPRRMEPGNEPMVRELHELCHPDEYPRPPAWYFVNPTLCVWDEFNNLLGFTSFAVNLVPGHGETMYGKDVCVHPAWRGQGIAECLHAARLQVGYMVGARVFMGFTHAENMPMRKILERSGMHGCIENNRMILYVGPINEV